MKSVVKYQKYVCTKCHAEDTVKYFVGKDTVENPPAILNCWNCHAGFQVDQQQQFVQRIGMIPVQEGLIA